MARLTFHWYLPTHGDGRRVAEKAPSRPATPSYLRRVARAAERAGFDGILIPAGPNCADPVVSAALVTQATKRLRPLVAIRPNAMHPTIAAKMVATLDQISEGRIAINIVTGGSPMELAMDGDHLAHDDRYRRTDEFIRVLKAAWRGKAFDFDGEFYQVKGAVFRPPPLQEPRPPIYLGGVSSGAVAVAREHADVHLRWGEPVERVAEEVRELRREVEHASRGDPMTALRSGLRINIVIAETRDLAWQKAREIVSNPDPHAVERLERYFVNSDSQSLDRIQGLRDTETSDPAFWTGMVPFRSGNSTALVGSAEDIVSSIKRYVAAGIEEFIFSSFPHDRAASAIGRDVISELRAWSA